MTNYPMPIPYHSAPNQGCQCGNPQQKKGITEVNAVKIELINPQAYGSAPQEPYMQNPIAQVPPTYSYPETQIYTPMPVISEGPTYFMNQPQEQKPVPFLPQQPLSTTNIVKNKSPERNAPPEPPKEKFVAMQTPAKKEIPSALVDQKIQTQPKLEPKAEVIPEQQNKVEAVKVQPAKAEIPQVKEEKPPIDVKPIIGSLKSDNTEQQFMAIQQIAEIGQSAKAPSDFLLNEEVFKGLSSIMTKDTSNMAGPTKEQKELREKKFSGVQLSAEQDKVAETLSPQEAAEMNKQFATYALAVVQKNFRDSVNKEATKQGLESVKLNEIPEVDTLIDNVKSNKNPLIREASISALSYIAKSEDKETLGIIFSIAAQDQDPIVRETAKKAQEKLTK